MCKILPNDTQILNLGSRITVIPTKTVVAFRVFFVFYFSSYSSISCILIEKKCIFKRSLVQVWILDGALSLYIRHTSYRAGKIRLLYTRISRPSIMNTSREGSHSKNYIYWYMTGRVSTFFYGYARYMRVFICGDNSIMTIKWYINVFWHIHNLYTNDCISVSW